MALHPNKYPTHRHTNSLFFLYCTEEQRLANQEQEQEQEPEAEDPIFDDNGANGFSSCSSILEQPTHLAVCEDEELRGLFSKERDQHLQNASVLENAALSLARTEAVEWVLKVNAFYGFSSLTALFAINYLDRILSGPHFQRDKPWMVQLLAVTCISLAAKVEEIRVPLLLDLQVEDSKYIFEAKTIQRMELLVLSALQWRMHPVTPVSFLGLFTRHLGLKNRFIESEFFRRCERILLSLVSDSRSVGFLPSVMAVSTMVSVAEEMGDCNPLDFQDRLLNGLKITKGRVKDCCNVIMEVSKRAAKAEKRRSWKRKQMAKEEETRSEAESEAEAEAGSPNGVMEANFSCESSNDSWGVGTALSSPTHCSSKRTRITHP
ncbi:cyclin-D3-1-like [Momordica charantia]|uniref:B-like cyclin n=1 Tax=Momordica charantia TaxID=3673 RepID=A0A6J1D1X4_MOMCH|nr:cyclin-D3-1-like [Momordica charantia]